MTICLHSIQPLYHKWNPTFDEQRNSQKFVQFYEALDWLHNEFAKEYRTTFGYIWIRMIPQIDKNDNKGKSNDIIC